MSWSRGARATRMATALVVAATLAAPGAYTTAVNAGAVSLDPPGNSRMAAEAVARTSRVPPADAGRSRLITAAAGTSQSAAARPAAARVSPTRIAFSRWKPGTMGEGTLVHSRVAGGLVMGADPVKVYYADPYGSGRRLAYDRGHWLSPWVRPGFGLTELIASYNAKTPPRTFIQISVRGRTSAAGLSSWDSLGRWASHDRGFHRMSLGAQRDDLSRVAVDTLVTRPGVSFTSWQARVALLRRTGSAVSPAVTMVGAMVSRRPGGNPPTSAPRSAAPVQLAVPRYSQMIHRGQYPQWDGGGEAWCSPTSTAMVLAYWGRGPTPRQYAWVNDSYADPWVDHAARFTYAWDYNGTGMWPFNTAYAAGFGLDSFVTRLRSLREAELFVRAGIPLVASIAFGRGGLDGAPIGATAGHLLVIRGFTSAGKVIVNDPAGASAAQVRRVYKRGQFERDWIGGTGGVVYVIHPRAKQLPAAASHTNW